jgi:hypothetical protein
MAAGFDAGLVFGGAASGPGDVAAALLARIWVKVYGVFRWVEAGRRCVESLGSAGGFVFATAFSNARRCLFVEGIDEFSTARRVDSDPPARTRRGCRRGWRRR